ncbi:MAG: competence/damage-inducible protein A [Candidatus Caenarcaniphilales bacterium]|nr:competence/damage-inducible protein A [Candidatus Caenarcaniphilales bacterium]
MQAEIVFIGTELLLGQIANSNAVFLGRELASLGIDCFYQTVVGDNKTRIKECLRTALERADLIITTGGLGPTPDDLTTECWAELFNEEMVFDQDILKKVESVFAKANKKMSASNRKLVYRPKTAEQLPNNVGSAPGIIWDVTEHCKRLQIVGKEKKLVMTFPGVPREMEGMWKETAIPYLSNLLGENKKLFYKELKFFGISESRLAEKVKDTLNLEDPTVAPLVSLGECRLRIASKSQDAKEAQKKIKGVEEQITKTVGEFIYGYDEDTLESVVGSLLKTKNKTLSLAESCTGGLISQRLTNVPGSSSYISLNVTTYSNESKKQILNVSQDTLEKYGAVSEQVALQMAKGIKNLAKTDYALSVTGIAGPSGGTIEKPNGTVYIAIIDEEDKEFIRKLELGNRSRNDIRWASSQEALNLVRQKLLGI